MQRLTDVLHLLHPQVGMVSRGGWEEGVTVLLTVNLLTAIF